MSDADGAERGRAGTRDIVRQLPWLQEIVAPLPPEAGLAPHEHWAWARIIRGLSVNMALYPAENAAPINSQAWLDGAYDGASVDPKDVADWPVHRTLSGEFLRTILFRDPWASARARSWVRIASARVEDDANWDNETFDGELQFLNSAFARGLSVNDSHIRGVFVLLNCRIGADLSAMRLKVDADCFIRDGTNVAGRVNMVSARVGGQLDVSALTAEGDVDLSGVDVASDALLRSTKAAVIHIRDAKIGRDLYLDGAQVNEIQGYGVDVGSDLLLGTDEENSGLRAKGEVCLRRAFVQGTFALANAEIGGELDLQMSRIEGQCFLREAKSLKDVAMGAAIVRGSLQLRQSKITGVVDLTGSRIGDELHLAKNAKQPGPEWGPDAKLIVRNVQAGALAGGLSAFRRANAKSRRDFIPCDLSGFRYARLGGLGGDEKGQSLANADGNDLREWLKVCRAKDHFDPDPYRALARGLREAGRADRAADVLNALGNYELVASGTPLLKRIGLGLSWLLIGYGQRNHRALMLYVALVIGAAAVGYWQDMASPPAGPEGWSESRAWLDWGGFAFGNSIPLVTLDAAHETFLVDRFCGERLDGVCQHAPPEGLIGFFYTAKLIGFLILSYLVAGLSGLAQKQE